MHTEFRSAAGMIDPADLVLQVDVLPSAWLHRPYLNLTAVEDTEDYPIHALGPEAAFDTLVSANPTPAPNQVHPSPRLRSAIAVETGVPWFDIDLPHEVPVELRTPRWALLVEMTGAFPTLGAEKQAALVTLLERLGLHVAIAELVPPQREDHVTTSPAVATLALRRAHSQRLTGRGTREEDTRLLELVALNGPDARYRMAAAITLVVAHARSGHRDVEQVGKWAKVTEACFDELAPGPGYPDVCYASMYWRAVSYVPFLRGDLRATEEMLAEAARCAEQIAPTTMGRRIAWLQNWHPLLETRTKTALAARDLDAALRWSQELTELDPLDAKVHLELGDVHHIRSELPAALRAYRRAAILGAPYRAYATYLAGRCEAELGHRGTAASLVETVRADVLSFSARQDIATLVSDVDAPEQWLTTWAGASLSALRTRLRSEGGVR